MYFNANDFGIRLKALCKGKNMTQKAIAKCLNISTDHLSKLERGKRNPSVDLVIGLAIYFGTSTDYLLMG